MHVDSSPGCSASLLPNQVPAGSLGKAAENDLTVWVPVTHLQDRRSSWFLALVRPGTGCCNYPGRELVHGKLKFLSLSFSLSHFHSFSVTLTLKINKYINIWEKKALSLRRVQECSFTGYFPPDSQARNSCTLLEGEKVNSKTLPTSETLT